MMHNKHYIHLGLMTALHFLAMYVLMYAMVDRVSSVYPNINQAYMAALMAAPMVLMELGIMRGMYKNKNWNIAIGAAAALVLVVSFIFIRAQTGVGDVQFVKSMIPHHSGAILMCERAKLQNPELKKLCVEIIKGQQNEIDQMKNILARLQQ